ncbi:unnamed protein product [Penicillium salamii]|uniref:Mit1 C-terminal Zn finger 2 domain-containing protein n=1 Tax=Penicillium salamii TaxID=1612424 RepID=A0A9W4NF61_9EURO|nr:unnamed protein product [Penicillium salamii]CAG8002166.1 unnamed protein product [Penicillium salamii]CAG8282101.1 unnamed protein product [Penicillium salamii]CAG8327089.1 unnamed protein product [Penicillium salamii]CAG8358392.1 unnamed protein product [Penicillium salamii]
MEADEDEEDLESILQHGAQALFNDDDSADIKYDIPAIDKLLDRSQVEQAKVDTHGDDSNSNNQNQFNFARVWQIDRDSLEEVVETEDAPLDSSVWQQILDEREREAQEQLSRKEEGLGRGKRKRPTISYNTKMQVDDEDDTELTPTNSPMAKMRKTAADHDYQEPDPAAAAESESDDNLDPMEDDDVPGMVNADNPPEMANADNHPGTVNADNHPDMVNVEDYPTPGVDSSQLATHNFPRIESPPPLPQDGFDGIEDENLLRPCQACQQIHWAGSCPLRLAGLEFCRLCGLAHYGYRRVCPRFQSVEQIQQLLQALDLSPEEPQLISLARRYLQTCLRGIQSRDNRIASAAQASAQSLTSPPINEAGIGHADSNNTDGGETIDLTQ